VSFDYAGYFGEITLLHDLTTRPEERTWKLTGPGRDPESHRVILYLGCNVLRTSHMIRTVTAIFDRLGGIARSLAALLAQAQATA